MCAGAISNFVLSAHIPTTRSITMPRGASPKREREYNELEEKFEKEGRYKGREQEVAARIVNKQRKEHGETKEQKESGKSAAKH
jgi:hypothetical protein